MATGESDVRPRPAQLSALHELPGRPCSVASALDLVGDKWSLLVVREIFFGNRRFNEIARNTGAPRDRLAARLRALVEAGVLEQREYQTAPSRSEYHLTAAGGDLAPVIRALLDWGDRWVSPTPPVTVLHGDHELDAESVCRACGEVVAAGSLRVRVNPAGWERQGPVTAG